MADAKSMADQVRALVLSKEPSFCAAVAGELALTCVPTAYEAAAELLASPTLAMVVDLRALGSRHARLLEIARQLGVEMLAVGPIPAWAGEEALSTVRIVSRMDLPAALRRLVEMDRLCRSEMDQAPVAAKAQAAPSDSPAPETPPSEAAESARRMRHAVETPHKEARREFEEDLRQESSRGDNGSGTYVETITEAARRRLADARSQADPLRKVSAPAGKPATLATPSAGANTQAAPSAPREPAPDDESAQRPPLSSLLSDAELAVLLEKEQ
jgi:hypothetical protein